MTPVFPRPNPRHPRRGVALLGSLLACGLTLNAQSDESDVARARDEFLSKVFTTCSQGTAYLGPHELYRVACTIPNPTNRVATAREVKDCAELIEYKDLKPAPRVTVVERPGAAGVPKALHPEGTLELALLPTDRLAAVEKRILLLISYTSSRSQRKIISAPFNDSAGRTQQFDAWGKPVPNVMPSTAVRLGDNQVEYQLPPGTMAFGLMTKKSGQWIFAPGPDFPAQPSPAQVLTRVGLDGGPVADAVGERMRALGPAMMVTPINELLAGSRVIQQIASGKPASCKALTQQGWGVPREGPLAPPPLVRPGTVLSPAAASMVNPPKFAGTADQFAAAVPDLLQRAAAAAGLDAQAFAKESEYVINSIQTCAQITPGMAADTIRKDVPSARKLVNLRTLGDRYAVCVQGGSTAPNAQFPDTRIAIQMLAGPDNWLTGKGFSAFVFFLRPAPGNRPIISATISGPTPVTK